MNGWIHSYGLIGLLRSNSLLFGFVLSCLVLSCPARLDSNLAKVGR